MQLLLSDCHRSLLQVQGREMLRGQVEDRIMDLQNKEEEKISGGFGICFQKSIWVLAYRQHHQARILILLEAVLAIHLIVR